MESLTEIFFIPGVTIQKTSRKHVLGSKLGKRHALMK